MVLSSCVRSPGRGSALVVAPVLGWFVACAPAGGPSTCPEPAAAAPAEGPRTTDGAADANEATVPTPVPADATIVVLVRHAEKASDGTDDPPLTEAGQRRARCLATQLHRLAPTHLLTTPYQRTAATLAPLAEATGLTPQVIAADDPEAWARALRMLPPGARAVVAGHSNTLPHLAAALGARLAGLDASGNLPHDEYDRVVHLVLDRNGHLVSHFDASSCRMVDPIPGS